MIAEPSEEVPEKLKVLLYVSIQDLNKVSIASEAGAYLLIRTELLILNSYPHIFDHLGVIMLEK